MAMRRTPAAMLLATSMLAVPALGQAADAPATGGFADIVVTAQRRAQNIQTVPIAITAVSGDLLREAGVRDARDLATLVPGLSMQAGSAAATTILFIRGVGITDFNSNTTGAVGVYVDDVYQGANAGKLFNIFDGDGVEVLKGPQGTLYGRNTTGGAIRFSSKKPSDDLEANVSALYGRLNEVRLEGGVGGPIVKDLLKVRVSGLYNQRDGTTFNRVTGNKVNDLDLWAGRIIVDLTPSADLLLRASAHIGRNRGGARQFQHRGAGVDFGGNPVFAPDGTPQDAFGYADTDRNIDAGDYDLEGREPIDSFGASLLAEWDFGAVKLTSISAYEQVEVETIEDTDASPSNVIVAVYNTRPEQFTQELRLQSTAESRLHWVVGGFYFNETLKTDSAFDILRLLRDPSLPLNGFDPDNSIGLLRYPYTQKTESFALFGQVDYDLTDRLTVTAGLRWSKDRIDMDYASFFDEKDDIAVDYTDLDAQPGTRFPIVNVRAKQDFDDVSWRFALAYKLDFGLLYASASKGYNSGGFSGAASTSDVQLRPYKSENLYAYEVGLKTDLLDRRLRFNAAAFYYDYKDLQVFVFDLSGAVPVQRKLNAGSAEIYGLEMQLAARPIDTLELSVGTSFLHTQYKDFAPGVGVDFTGNRLTNAPEIALTGAVNWTLPLGSRGAVKAHLDGQLVSDIFITPDNAPSYRVPDYFLANARLSWTAASERFEVALWARNITNTRYVTYIAPVITQDQLNYNDPPTYGLELVLRY